MSRPKLENYKIQNDPDGSKAYSLYLIDKKLHVKNRRQTEINNIIDKLNNKQALTIKEINKLSMYSKLGIKYLFR